MGILSKLVASSCDLLCEVAALQEVSQEQLPWPSASTPSLPWMPDPGWLVALMPVAACEYRHACPDGSNHTHKHVELVGLHTLHTHTSARRQLLREF